MTPEERAATTKGANELLDAIDRRAEVEKASAELAQALKPRTTLWDLTSEIAELFDLAATAETEEYRAAAEQALEAYREQLPGKIDDTRAYIKHQRMIAAAATQEANEQRDRAKAAANRAERAEQYVLNVMLAMRTQCRVCKGTGHDEVGGGDCGNCAGEGSLPTKKLSGRTGEFTVRANPPAVEITREDLLPSAYWRFTVIVPGGVWNVLAEFFERFHEVVRAIAPSVLDSWQGWRASMQATPDKAAIAAALKAPCPACGGQGMTGTEMTEHSSCRDCGGSGKASVPGARLTRGSRLVVK